MQTKPYYGQPPDVIATSILLNPSEMCFVQYLPIKMASGEQLGHEYRIPANLQWTQKLVDQIKEFVVDDDYVYLTAKHIYVLPSNMGNRAGWHSDGFLTPDINYIWVDKFETHFAVQSFNLTLDCELSMKEMQEQVDLSKVVTYGVNNLLKLDQYNIHQSPVKGEGMRTFIKLSVSKQRYNLAGNAHNYLFDYNWNMKERSASRNHPY